MAKEGRPPIDVSKPRYDLSTYGGRLRHFASATSPLTLLSSKSDLKAAQKLLDDYADGKRPDLYPKEREDEVWKAKQLVDSSLHSDTHEPVPLPFRLSAFVPTNLVIVTGMLLPNPSLASIVGWQWANQTLNVCVNYFNANKSVPMSNTEVAVAYTTATATSVGLAVGLNRLVPRLKSLSPGTKALAGRLVPFVAVASAGCVNVGAMRWKELRDGVDVFPPAKEGSDEKPESLGKSPTAGRYAVGQTALSRVLTNAPTLVFPPLIMAALQKRGTFGGSRGKALETVVHLGIIGTSLLLFLPPAIATFPQRASVSPSRLEARFQDVKDPSTGKPYDRLEFNKGL